MTNQQHESDLQQAFALHASGVPIESVERLRGIDYDPRTSRISPRLTVGALAGAVATTGAVASVVVLGSAQAAFAGWSPSPTSTSAEQSSTAEAACQARLAAAPAMPGAGTVSDWSVATTDVRGPFTLVVYENSSTEATCLTGPSITMVSRSAIGGDSTTVSGSSSGVSGHGGSASMISGTGSGAIKQISMAHLTSTSQGSYTLVEGRVDQDVTGVTLVRSDGQHIEASTGNGWFVAWWPGSEGAPSAEITTASGETTQTLNTALPAPPVGSGTCNHSSQTTSAAVVCTGRAAGSGSGGPSTTTRDGGGITNQ